MREIYLEQNYCSVQKTFTVSAPCNALDLSGQCNINDITISPTNPQINQTVYISYSRSIYNNNQYCKRKVRATLTIKDPDGYVAKTCQNEVCINPMSYGTISVSCQVVVNKVGTWSISLKLEDVGEC